MFLHYSFWKYPVLLHCYSGVGVVCSSKAQLLQLRALLVALQVRERYPVVVCLAKQD